MSRDWVDKMNRWGAEKIPFFFFISFDKSEALIYKLNTMPDGIKYKINSIRSDFVQKKIDKKLKFKTQPVSREIYNQGFDKVMKALQYGDSYLINLTFPSMVETNFSLSEIYSIALARYKLLIPGKLVIFSPECFVKIQQDYIYSYPMKGTIDASIENAENLLLSDEKEQAEHYTIVDLIRNDLSIISEKVEVTKFRYLDTIHTSDKTLLQSSSEIRGRLDTQYHAKLGDIFDKLLPAGSISGAPKNKTIEVIKDAEICDRGFYTGVFGIFDGQNLDSAVAIRFIEKKEAGLFYRSGGGITASSQIENEYQELINKIYVPTDRKYLD